MKRTLLLTLMMSICVLLNAQDIDKTTALQLVTNQSKAIGLSQDDLQNLVIKNAYRNSVTGADMVYAQQSFKGIPVFNQLLVLAFKNGVLVSKSGAFLKSIDKLSGFASSSPGISPSNAVLTALAEKKIQSNQPLVPVTTNSTKVDFGKMGIAHENITAELIWTPLNDGKEVKLTWEVYLVPTKTSDYWMIRVDANMNRIVDENNLTVYCDWGTSHSHENTCFNEPAPEAKPSAKPTLELFPSQLNGPSLVGTVNYLVIPYPAESPIHPGGTAALRTNPWTLAGGNATSLGWHNDGVLDYEISRGNNVWAQEDRDNSNNTFGLPATSTTTPDPLNFNFPPDYTVAPTTPAFQQFAITNLFYWNNIIHDLAYIYGFDEVSGNFQNNNQGRGGNGNDYVIGDAQDAGGTNNANFATPVDGNRPRMQMYLWTTATPQKDGDLDAGIIVHEYGHGISNRFTGGPGTTSCLGNAEHMGEGWSDYLGLMATHDWSIATVTDGFTKPRGIGTYALNQPITGVGIRQYRYTTNMAINPMTYANLPTVVHPHGTGTIWCTVLWDMTWKLIETDGINPNLFNPSGTGGNSVAMKLVMEGMRLQPCSPGFIDGRNAILKADTLLYGGVHSCAIMEAFARRGMGANASQGSSNSRNDQTVDFSGGLTMTLTQNVTQIPEGQNIVYTNTVTTCSPLVNYLITDTLPLNVTYVSGGSYDAATRVVSFPVNQASNTTQTYTFTVNVNVGSYFPPIILLDEQVTGNTIPPSWTATSTTATNWIVTNAQSHSAPYSFFTANLPSVSDQILTTTNNIPIGTTPPQLSFWHWYNSESGWDGGVVEVSTNNGGTWADLGPNMTQNPYNGSLGTSTGPLSGRQAFNGNSAGFIQTKVNMAPYANQNIKLRWRFGSDNSVSGVGWYLDDIEMKTIATVQMRSNLFNASGVRIVFRDTVTIITGSVACVNVAITTQPANQNVCSGNNGSFTVTATGTSPTYQWEESTNGGSTWTPISGATAATLNLTGITPGMDGYQYRVVVSNGCPSTVTSNAATLNVTTSASISSQPANVAVCAGSNASFTVIASGSTLTYQWQLSTNGGGTWADITGQANATINLTSVTAAMNGNQYRVVVFSCGPTGLNSSAATLTVNTAASVTGQPANTTVCAGTNATFNVTATGTNLTYQWQVSTNGGTTWTDLASQTSATLTLNSVTTAMNANQYRVRVSGTCTPAGINSAAATLTVNAPVSVTSQPVNAEVCAGLNTSFSVTVTGTAPTYQWQVSTNGGTTWTNIGGATTATLNLTAVTIGMNGNLYRAVLNGTCTVNLNSNAASLTVNTPVTITSQPVNASVCTGSSTSFSITATGTSITYQWQESINGGAFQNISNGAPYSGATTNTLTINPASQNLNGRQYRVVASGVPCGGVTSVSASLTVNPLPRPVLTLASYSSITPYVRASMNVTVSPPGNYAYQWYKNGFLVPSFNSDWWDASVDDFGEYQVAVTDIGTGCSNLTNRVTLRDSVSTMLFIYPNPSSGTFMVRYHSANSTNMVRTLNVYDSKGSRVYSSAYNITRTYDRMEVNLNHAASGVYMVELKDAAGTRIASGKLVIKK